MKWLGSLGGLLTIGTLLLAFVPQASKNVTEGGGELIKTAAGYVQQSEAAAAQEAQKKLTLVNGQVAELEAALNKDPTSSVICLRDRLVSREEAQLKVNQLYRQRDDQFQAAAATFDVEKWVTELPTVNSATGSTNLMPSAQDSPSSSHYGSNSQAVERRIEELGSRIGEHGGRLDKLEVETSELRDQQAEQGKALSDVATRQGRTEVKLHTVDRNLEQFRIDVSSGKYATPPAVRRGLFGGRCN